ncbi:MAG: oligosaccharide flippase family protein [Methylococcales bacterium]
MHFGNILWNLVGLGLPLLIAALTIPELITVIGSERFGLLALAWGLIGYAGALDLGIGRATTQRVSAMRESAENQQIPHVLATAIRITYITGGIGMLVILIAAACRAYSYIQTNNVAVLEIQISMVLLALALPMQAISATYRGVNEAYLNFKDISILRVFLGATNFGLPYLIASYTTKLYWLVATLVFSRCLALVFYRYFAHRCMNDAGHIVYGKYTKDIARQLFQFGGWVTVSSIISPILVQADRFFVGGLISASAITLYVIPYEVVTQALIIVGAITTIAFPVITNLIHNAPQQATITFRLWLYRITGLMLIILSILAAVMPILLKLWVGQHISEESIWTGQILCIGVFFNSIGAMYYALLHAQGQTQSTAILHLIEFPLYILLLIILINTFGIVGCAIAWSIRTLFDTIGLILMSKLFERKKRARQYATV